MKVVVQVPTERVRIVIRVLPHLHLQLEEQQAASVQAVEQLRTGYSRKQQFVHVLPLVVVQVV